MPVPSPGWARDPHGKARLRYWDGAAWTDRVFDTAERTGARSRGKAPRLTDPRTPSISNELDDTPFLEAR